AWVQIGGGDVPDWAVDYDCLAADGDPSPLGIDRSPEDLFFLYTGGTTGMPKGVMWSQSVWRQASREGAEKAGLPYPSTMEEFKMAVQLMGKTAR
ncbi:MAG TPA: acyl-CoA synthetase, partial [Hyphomonas sp.]|nr:acyl-CoA synthetase [Hyphomonas sp.]